MEETVKQKSTQHKKEFLKAYREEFTIYHACKKIGVSRSCYYKWMREDEEFKKAVALTEADIINDLEKEARRRAFEGVNKPVYQGKELVGHIKEYSDTLLIFLLKGLAPEKYRERVENSGTMNMNLDLTWADLVKGVNDNSRAKTSPAQTG